MSNAIKEGTFNKCMVRSEFCNITKSEILKIGNELGVAYQETWTCYEGNERPCLKCGTCVERTEAFIDNNLVDPLLTDEEWEKAREIYLTLK